MLKLSLSHTPTHTHTHLLVPLLVAMMGGLAMLPVGFAGCGAHVAEQRQKLSSLVSPVLIHSLNHRKTRADRHHSLFLLAWPHLPLFTCSPPPSFPRKKQLEEEFPVSLA